MIRLLTGTIASSDTNHVVIATAGGVGYLVGVNSRFLGISGDSVTLHTYLAVRETALDLYGFIDPRDREFFELLLTLPGVGPKSAMQILDQADRSLIIEALRLEDAAHLAKLSPISKKTAEKIVLGLKDKVDTTFLPDTHETTTSSQYQDAFDTLMTLGYNPVSIRQVLDSADQTSTTSQMVKDALRQLS